ncbi:MAG TPA: HAD hydrolase-like protein, partial [Nitrospiraceae bacterium]
MKKTPVNLLIFDLDGTLIESKWDIAKSVNLTLAELGLPERPLEEIFGYVGDGVKKLLRLSVGEGHQAS